MQSEGVSGRRDIVQEFKVQLLNNLNEWDVSEESSPD